MTKELRVVIGEDEPDTRQYFEEVVEDLGHAVVGSASSGDELVEIAREVRPTMLLTDIKMDGIDGIEAAQRICQIEPIPVILISAYYDERLIKKALRDHVMAYLVKPVRAEDIKTAIPLALRRFAELTALAKEADDLKEALEGRKLVERAKGILMKKTGLDEEQAFRRLQDLASRHNMKMLEIARMIITGQDAFEPK